MCDASPTAAATAAAREAVITAVAEGARPTEGSGEHEAWSEAATVSWVASEARTADERERRRERSR